MKRITIFFLNNLVPHVYYLRVYHLFTFSLLLIPFCDIPPPLLTYPPYPLSNCMTREPQQGRTQKHIDNNGSQGNEASSAHSFIISTIIHKPSFPLVNFHFSVSHLFLFLCIAVFINKSSMCRTLCHLTIKKIKRYDWAVRRTVTQKQAHTRICPNSTIR